jgi:hypothetical protein
MILLPRPGVSGVIPEEEAGIVRANEDSAVRTRQTSAMVRRIRAIDPRRLDLLVAVALIVEFQVELALLAADHAPHHGLVMAALVIEGASFALLRRAPIVPMAASLGVIALLDAIGATDQYNLYLPFLSAFVALFCVGRFSTPRMALAGALLGMALFAFDSAVDPENDSTLEVVVWSTTFVCGPILVGRFMRNRAALHQTLRDVSEARIAPSAAARTLLDLFERE